MYTNIINAITAAAADRKRKFAEHFAEVVTIGDLRKSYNVKNYTTPKQCERLLAMDDSEVIPDIDRAKIIQKNERETEKALKKTIDRLNASGGFTIPKSVNLYITWTRNNTWGWNPHCECTVDYESRTHGTASGCGYDKTSAAIAEALNASPAVLKALYNWIENGGHTYGINNPLNRSMMYAPYFEGGCGVSTIIAAFQGMGYKFTDHTSYNRRGTEESRYIHFWLE